MNTAHATAIHRPFPGCSIASGSGPGALDLRDAGLSEGEIALHGAIAGARKTRWIRGRLAARDAVRQILKGPLPPFVSIGRFPSGAPQVEGIAGMHVSIAHSGEQSVAIASIAHPVAIDWERVQPRSEAFEARAFTPAELRWLDTQTDRSVAATRLWTAREAAAKLAGTGLRGRPREWGMTAATAKSITIQGACIATRVIDGHVLAWGHGQPSVS